MKLKDRGDKICSNWDGAHEKYDWRVDLRSFDKAADYPGYFNRIIESAHTAILENEFRKAINTHRNFKVAGEVCFWKNYKNFKSKRNTLTEKLLTHLKIRDNWNSFVRAIKQISKNPSYDNFLVLQNTCGQKYGFAVPITFLSFYNPSEYPMVDKKIAYWWTENRASYGYGTSPIFSQRGNGWIQTNTISRRKQNWNAYIHWKRFCSEYAMRIASYCGLNWRARDIEMTVWEAYKRNISLEILPAAKKPPMMNL